MTTPIVELLNGVSAGENRNRSNQNFAALLQIIEEKGFVWQGDYIDALEYIKGDIVKYNHSLYIAKIPTTGLVPTNNSAWDLLVESFQGETGPTGPQGTGITSIVRTSGSGTPGTFDTYTITFSNATTTTFQVWNGSNGTGDMNKTDNLSGLANYTTARTNMGVYSKTEVDGLTHAAPNKVIPVDGDEVSLYDSTTSFTLARLKWSNIKATLKTYFDTLYQAALGYTAANDSNTVHISGTETISGAKTFSSTITVNAVLKATVQTLTYGGIDRMNWNQYDAGSGARRTYMSVYDQAGNWLGNPIEVDNFPVGEGTREIRLTYDRIKVNGIELGAYIQNKFTTINSQTGTTYTFALTDAWSMVTFNNAATQTITVPPNSSIAFPIGTQIDCAQLGAGKVTFAQGAGVTIQSKAGNKSISAQYVGASLKKIGTDTWLLFGDLIA